MENSSKSMVRSKIWFEVDNLKKKISLNVQFDNSEGLKASSENSELDHEIETSAGILIFSSMALVYILRFNNFPHRLLHYTALEN